MNVQDYLVDHADIDWSAALQEWNWLLPPVFRVWLLTRAGDLFITTPDGSIQMLEVGAGELRPVAESREEFFWKIEDPSIANDWLMIPVIDALKAGGVTHWCGPML